MDAQKQFADLQDAINLAADSAGAHSVEEFEDSCAPVVTWLDYFNHNISNHNCDELLAACKASLIESAACLSVGLVRSAIFAIRLEYELFLAWMYFNDHPVEWSSTSFDGTDFPMRRNNLDYLGKFNKSFKKRVSLLESVSTREEKDPYGKLSKFVHGSSLAAMPTFDRLSEVVQNQASINACILLQRDVSEFLSDIATAWLADRWHDIPTSVKVTVADRLGAAKLKEFCV